MPDKPPTVAVLHERLGTSIKLGIGFASLAAAVAVYFLITTSKHGERLATIEGKVQDISDNVNRLLDRRSKNLLTAPGDAAFIASNAGDIKDAASWARHRKLDVPTKKLTDTASSLLTVGNAEPSVPDVWNAFSEVLNYRTEIDAGTDVEATITRHKTKPCASNPPLVRGDSGGKGKDYVQKTPFEYSDCYLNLDKPGLPPIVMREGGFGVLCKNCVVEYSGGPIPMRVELLNCLFVLHLQSRPPDAGLRLAREMVENPKSVVAG